MGGPTGLTGKYYLSSTTGIQFGLGFGGHGWVGGHVDYVIAPMTLVSSTAGQLYPYFGGGIPWAKERRGGSIT